MDTQLYMWVNDLSRDTPWAHGVLAVYAEWAGPILLAVLLIGGWLWGRRQTDAPARFAVALLAGVGVVLAVLINEIVITRIFERPRPCTTHPDALTLLPCTPDNAFPSSHALIAGAFAAGLFLVNRRLGIVATVAALFEAFGRVYVGMHHPGDVSAGLLIGAVITLITVLVLRGVATRIAESLNRTVLRPVISVHVPRRALRAGGSPATPSTARQAPHTESFAPPQPQQEQFQPTQSQQQAQPQPTPAFSRPAQHTAPQPVRPAEPPQPEPSGSRPPGPPSSPPPGPPSEPPAAPYAWPSSAPQGSQPYTQPPEYGSPQPPPSQPYAPPSPPPPARPHPDDPPPGPRAP